MTYEEAREKLLKDPKTKYEYNKLNEKYKELRKELEESSAFENLLEKITKANSTEEQTELLKKFEHIRFSSICWTCERADRCPAWNMHTLGCKFFKKK